MWCITGARGLLWGWLWPELSKISSLLFISPVSEIFDTTLYHCQETGKLERDFAYLLVQQSFPVAPETETEEIKLAASHFQPRPITNHEQVLLPFVSLLSEHNSRSHDQSLLILKAAHHRIRMSLNVSRDVFLARHGCTPPPWAPDLRMLPFLIPKQTDLAKLENRHACFPRLSKKHEPYYKP